MTVLGAPKELEALVGLFEKLYVCTFDSCAFYGSDITQKKTARQKLHKPPLCTGAKITVFILFVPALAGFQREHAVEN